MEARGVSFSVMKMSLDTAAGKYLITGYDRQGIHINRSPHAGSLIVSAETLRTDWGPVTVEDLSLEHLKQIWQLDPDIVLLGTGQHLRRPARDLLLQLAAQGRSIEIMDTPAACRTFNILLAEQRRVVAVLLPLDSSAQA